MTTLSADTPASRTETLPTGTAYAIAGLSSHASNLLMGGIFFYTTQKFGWKPWQNLALAAGQGALYAFGGLQADRLSRRLGRRGTMVAVHLAMAVLGVALLLSASPAAIAVILVAYTFFSAASWPMLTSVLSSGAEPRTVAQRISIYNLVWSGVAAVTVAISGSIIDHWPAGLFVVPAVAHLIAVTLVRGSPASVETGGDPVMAPIKSVSEHADAHLHHLQRLSLWLSRISLPAVFVVVYSMLPLMPSLPALSPLTTSSKTAVCSVWMITRCLMFGVLAATAWWHSPPRPRRLLLGAAAVMLLAFLGITLRASSVARLATPSLMLDVTCVVLSQVVLGLAMGLIYTSSLYFAMVLSDGDPEHGGHHEALVGLGSVVGPGAGAVAQLLAPGTTTPSIIAVAAILSLTLLMAVGRTMTFRAR